MKLPFTRRTISSTQATAKMDESRTTAHFDLGRRGEERAVEYLIRLGYRMVAANFIVPIGRNRREVVVTAEIDIVAYDGPVLCFIEVKSRASGDFAPPQVNVDLRKRRQVARAARGYRAMLGLMNAPYRYDVVTVVWPKPYDNEPRIELLKNFWSESKLRKRSWYPARWD